MDTQQLPSQPIDALKNVFHLEIFRPNQQKIIEDVLQGRDVIALLPTGSGKSLCYQLPAVITSGVTVVIAPLLALIDDQIAYLDQIGVPSKAFNSQATPAEKRQILQDLQQTSMPQCKILYTTPEAIIGHGELRSVLSGLHQHHRLSRIVIDEVHCVSNWGHEFRPAYLELKQLKVLYPGVPIVSLTATATPRVQMDIVLQLGLKRVYMHRQSFVRHNLSYYVIPKTHSTVVYDMYMLIQTHYRSQSGIIYCFTRKECETVAHRLTTWGIKSEHFHAGLATETKRELQTLWLTNRIQVIVATIAFGLGINKPDVRFVIHYSLPKSIEGYYQETGRAGRDGLPSDCYLYYSRADKRKLEYVLRHNKDVTAGTRAGDLQLLRLMDFYCNNDYDCRKFQLSNYLGEYQSFRCSSQDNMCDNCQGDKRKMRQDMTPYLKQIRDLFQSHNRIEASQFVEQLYRLLYLSQGEIYRLLQHMVVEKYLQLVTTIESHQIAEYYRLDETCHQDFLLL